MKNLFCAVAALGAGMASAGILFEEDFSNYNDFAPNIAKSDKITYSSEPIYEHCGWVNATFDKDADLFTVPKALPAKNAFDLLFWCEICATNSAFDVTFADGAGKTLAIPFAGKKGKRELALKADGGKLVLWQAISNRFEQIKTYDLPGEMKTMNFRIKAGGKVRLTKIVIRTPEALPSRAGLDQFPARVSWDQPLAGAAKAKTFVSDGSPLDLATKGYSFIPGATGTVGRLEIEWDSGVKHSHPITVQEERYASPLSWCAGLPQLGIKANEKWVGADAVIQFGWLHTYYVRPCLRCYTSWHTVDPLGIDLVRDWKDLPAASKHVTTVELRETSARGLAQLWIDGSFATTLSPVRDDKKGRRVVKAALVLNKGVAYRVNAVGRAEEPQLWAKPKAKAFAGAKLKEGQGERSRSRICEPVDSADVGLAHYAQGVYAMSEDGYTMRTPSDGYPGEVHWRLPAAPYNAATIRFALDDAPGKVPYLIARFAHYTGCGTGYPEIVDSVLDLTKGIPDTCRVVGAVVRGGKEYPIYETKIELPLGKFLDFAAGDFIDLDFAGPMEENFQQCDNRQKPRKDVSSAFNLFGLTLEKLNVLPELVQLSPGNIFTLDEEKKATSVKLTALEDGAKGTIAFGEDRRTYALAKKGDVVTNEFDFSDADVGLYRIPLVIACGAPVDATPSSRRLTHELVCCVTPEAGRNVAVTNSPFCTWDFHGSHGTPSDMRVVGPLFQKAGIRRSTYHPKKDELAQYDIASAGNIAAPGFHEFDPKTGRFRQHGKLDGEAWFVQNLKDQIKKADCVDNLMVWHESAPGCNGIPEEVLGLEPPKDDKKRETEYAGYINEIGRICRKHFPWLRIKIGNTSASLGAVAIPLRGGAKAEYYDAIGIEIGGQTLAPERLQECSLLGQNITKATAKKLSGRDIPTDATFEFIYRCERDFGADGENRLAEFHARDAIISLMHDFKLVSLELLTDCRNGYCSSVWGASGLVCRSPTCYPKLVYLSYAVVTKVLDGVKFVRLVPTGSDTVYAAEFARMDGKTVTAFWCARGEADLVCDGSGELWEMYGKRESVGGWFRDAKFEAGTAPKFLVSSKPVKSVKIAGRRFAADQALVAKGRRVVDFSLANATVAPDPDYESQLHRFLPYLKPGTFTAKDVVDPEEGACLEITLDTAAKTPFPVTEFVTEYTTVRLKKPVEMGAAGLVGLRVKGNSSWGQVRFEIEDAKGEVFKGMTTGADWWCSVYDWPGYTALSFDGWGDVYQYTDDNHYDMIVSPGPRDEQWVSATGGDKKIQFPVKIRAVTVCVNRYKPMILGFIPTENPSIRLKGVWAAPVRDR